MKRTTYFKLGAVVAAAGLFLWFGLTSPENKEVVSPIGLGMHGPKPEMMEQRSALRVPGSAARGRDIALNKVYAGYLATFFCTCPFDASGAVKLAGCSYSPQAGSEHSARVVWTHIVPPSRFGEQRQCWKEGHPDCVKPDGRKYKGRWCCAKRGVDEEFRSMHLDLQNLVPVIDGLRKARSGYPFGEISGEERRYGTCDFEVQERVVEPPRSKRGDIARVYLYLADIHGMPMLPAEREMFEKWHQEDPPSQWERKRNLRIKETQQVGNPYVELGG
jgi:deoxyribonuclease-1